MAPGPTSAWLGKFADLAALDEDARRTLAGDRGSPLWPRKNHAEETAQACLGASLWRLSPVVQRIRHPLPETA